jgi:hypothetical protein
MKLASQRKMPLKRGSGGLENPTSGLHQGNFGNFEKSRGRFSRKASRPSFASSVPYARRVASPRRQRRRRSTAAAIPTTTKATITLPYKSARNAGLQRTYSLPLTTMTRRFRRGWTIQLGRVPRSELPRLTITTRPTWRLSGGCTTGMRSVRASCVQAVGTSQRMGSTVN